MDRYRHDIYNVRVFSENQSLVFAGIGASAVNADHSVTVNVPEPAPLALLGIALVGFAASRRISVKQAVRMTSRKPAPSGLFYLRGFIKLSSLPAVNLMVPATMPAWLS